MMRGIDALSRREYSRLELYRKLMRTLTEGETADDVIAVLDDLQAKGYLSDERYAEGRVRVRSMRYGNRRVAQELRQQGWMPTQSQPPWSRPNPKSTGRARLAA